VHGEHTGWRWGRRWSVTVAVAVAGAMSLAGCSGGGSPTPGTRSSSTTATVTVPSTSSPSPSLTLEQQAAEEAKAAYADYQRIVDAVNQRGGGNARRDLSVVALGAQLEFLVQDANRLAQNHCVR